MISLRFTENNHFQLILDFSSHLGVPLDFGDECPPGFVTHIGKTISEGKEILTIYCVLTTNALQMTKDARFKTFCMFLLNENRETCPKGFTI